MIVLLAGLGYAGCEVLAIPNLLLRRGDTLWCLLYSPMDRREAHFRSVTWGPRSGSSCTSTPPRSVSAHTEHRLAIGVPSPA